jgi:hypothetical protein
LKNTLRQSALLKRCSGCTTLKRSRAVPRAKRGEIWMPDLGLPAKVRPSPTLKRRLRGPGAGNRQLRAPASPNLPGVGLLSDPRSPLSVPALSASASEVARRTERWQTVRECAAHPRVRLICAEHYLRSGGIILARVFHEPQHLRYAQHRCLIITTRSARSGLSWNP